MKKGIFVIAVFILLGSASLSAQSYPGYSRGNITSLTSIPEGLLIMLSSGDPTNANQSTSGWLFISNSYTAMISAVLISWNQNLTVLVYTNGSYFSSSVVGGSFGEVNQVNPVSP